MKCFQIITKKPIEPIFATFRQQFELSGYTTEVPEDEHCALIVKKQNVPVYGFNHKNNDIIRTYYQYDHADNQYGFHQFVHNCIQHTVVSVEYDGSLQTFVDVILPNFDYIEVKSNDDVFIWHGIFLLKLNVNPGSKFTIDDLIKKTRIDNVVPCPNNKQIAYTIECMRHIKNKKLCKPYNVFNKKSEYYLDVQSIVHAHQDPFEQLNTYLKDGKDAINSLLLLPSVKAQVAKMGIS